MTELLQKAMAEAEKLPDSEQDSFARWFLEELASERRWSQAFAASSDKLAELADEALDEHGKGTTQVLEPEKL